MPLYTYINESTGETIDVLQSMNDKHEYFDKKGKQWKRVWTIPSANIDSHIDPNSEADFVKYTGKRKGKLGDLYDLSAEMSAKRAEKNSGLDPVREAYYDAQEKKTGVKSFERKRRDANKALEKIAPGVSIE